MRKETFFILAFSLICSASFAVPAKGARGGPAAARSAAGSPAVDVLSVRAVPGVFNYLEFAGEHGKLYATVWPMWQRIMKEGQKTPFFTADGKNMNAVDAKTWRNLVAAAKKNDEPGAMRMVNAFFNQWRPKSDMQAWAVEEYWSTPEEFVSQRGGDCEDYAVAKYFALRFLGFDIDRMRIVVVRRKDASGEFLPDLHAVLAVKRKDADSWFILDNNARPRDAVIPHTSYKGRFVPLFSVNENGSWGYMEK